MSEFVPYGRQWIDEDDIQSVVEVLRSDFLTTGPMVRRFEEALERYTGSRHAVALNSGTSALHAAYFAAGLRPGDEIVTTPLTFAATANAALYLGAQVRFVDVEPDTGNLDPAALPQAVGERTRLIVPVDYTGHPADYDAITRVARTHGLRVVADAAHSLGAYYKGRPVGTLADATELSFHPVKPVTTAEGGAVLTDDPVLAERAATFRSHGIVRDPARMQQAEGPWYYEVQQLGYNYRLTDVQSALGLSQLRKLDAFIARRRAIAERYFENLRDLPQLQLPAVRPDVKPGWHLFVVRVVEPKRRRAFFERLRDLGLGVQVHYIPVHWHPIYQELGFKRGQFPRAEDYYARAVSLPIFPKMSDADVDSVIERVRRAVREVL
ncbi:UDP-4-keto-6-deoxy-N-acetylglucosamine 4-aminotransferase [Oceanithermus profundus DSM 14977]|uniref:UDP-4-keto-6-deoxy-N-acetylglucosamine 4-aminotransferase n=1 Tax=Oceanithermus profundus (strain DSM 14977 / NBRC 100410 / VKM B-2274 / 506) TaxID=670487 RepID=E4U5E3_OCEP5|nr:UDP-4-amino-4,6-dideoxy-N-acetyl-beta-L-altrosamine transaminase [Oceanithermus profundus]ADR37617.1 UDP-4-keto-6-deoxy-N-acetylglucosamine 4-aminotransferase [Oceanithermus profundus DSM 14977]